MVNMSPADVCASDFGVYAHPCEMAMRVCEMYARKYIDVGDVPAAERALEDIAIEEDDFCRSK